MVAPNRDMLARMEGRGPRDTAIPPSSVLKGRLSDVFVPALVGGATSALARRLGTRATLDDPQHGRSASVASIEGCLVKLARAWHDADAELVPVASTTGVDCDVSEGVLRLRMADGTAEMPIAVVAERQSMREIDVRLYYAVPGRLDARSLPVSLLGPEPRAAAARDLLAALREGELERAVDLFREDAVAVDTRGGVHRKEDGALAAHLAPLVGLDLGAVASADDGRRCSLEIARRTGASRHRAALFVLVRAEDGRLAELRAYGSALG